MIDNENDRQGPNPGGRRVSPDDQQRTGLIDVRHGDCLDVLRTLPDASVDAVVTDPPYELGFMGKRWDGTGIAYDVGLWAECLRVLRPGGHLAAFGGTRTYHRMTCAIEDAGFEIRDSIGSAYLAWVQGSGFPKSKTVLKPAWEPIVLARNPFKGSETANVLAHGTGALNVAGCRVGTGAASESDDPRGVRRTQHGTTQAWEGGAFSGSRVNGSEGGRWPANVLLTHGPDCADECTPGCPVAELDAQSGILHSQDPATRASKSKRVGSTGFGTGESIEYADTGGASRFFPTFRYQAKAPTRERPKVDGVAHPTVKPLALMAWLVRLVTPPGGVVLDPFAGSGTTLQAARDEGFDAIGIEREATYLPLIAQRLGIEPVDPIREAIAAALDREALLAVWRANRDAWTDDDSLASKARLAELDTAAVA